MKKYLPYVLIIFVFLMGFLGLVKTTHAEGSALGTCSITITDIINLDHGPYEYLNITSDECDSKETQLMADFLGGTPHTIWVRNPSAGGDGGPGDSSSSSSKEPTDPSGYRCSLFGGSVGIMGCVLGFFDKFIIATFGFVLWLIGQLVNVLIFLSLSSFIYESDFAVKAWTVVRDFSNIFFIIILLFISIKIILDLGGGEAKKMISKVIVAAMLINFSMFFTGIVIDASNILGYIFYNKVAVEMTGHNAEYNPILAFGRGEKDITGGLIGKFMPTKLISEPTIEQARKPLGIGGALVQLEKAFVGVSVLLSLFSLTAALIVVGIVVFLLVALAFLNRIATLLFLLIFSPFAFMSFAFPKLGELEYVGWKDWTSRLLKNAFFAPIFLFMVYFIFMLINSGLIDTILKEGTNDPVSFIKTLLNVFLGFNLIMLLLWFAIKFAYKSSGKTGELVVKAAKTAGVVVGAVATAGAGAAVTSAVGGVASKALADKGLQKAALLGDKVAQFKLSMAKKAQGVDFTEMIHGATGGKMRSGLVTKIGEFTDINTKGGYEGMVERSARARREEVERYKSKESPDEIFDRTTEERKNYDDKKHKAMEKVSGGTEEEIKKATAAFEKENGPEPKIYHNADEYNKDIIQKFTNNLGKRGTLGAIAEKNVRSRKENGIVDESNFRDDKEYEKQHKRKYGDAPMEKIDKDIAEKINGERILKEKVTIGRGSQGGAAAEGQLKVAKELEKEAKKLGDVNERIASMEKSVEAQTKSLKKQVEHLRKAEEYKVAATEKNAAGEEVLKKDEHGNVLVDTGKLSIALATEKATRDQHKAQADAISKNIADIDTALSQATGRNKADIEAEKVAMEKVRDDITRKYIESIVKIEGLEKLSGIEKTIEDTRSRLEDSKNKLFDLSGKKGDLQGGNKPPSSEAPKT